MSLEAICAWIQALPLAKTIADSTWLFPTIESLHVIALTLVVGSIAVVDLRLLGVRAGAWRASTLTRHVLPFTWGAFVLAVVTGSLLFSSQAVTYAANAPFRAKVVLLAVAGLNMAVFHALAYRHVEHWDAAERPPVAARVAGAISLATWTGIVFLGRWIAFAQAGS